ncbi:MAG: hypothetical protein JW714_00885 [Candidatus Omnitrophica bacterium]|nr:hypothetical protein [Candidatus Omnitrophota bacterium]
MDRNIEERRKPIICPNCGHVMVCMNKFESVYNEQDRSFYIWYICPSRYEEGGCGYSLLLEYSAKKKELLRTVAAFQLEKVLPKSERKIKK